MIIWINKRVDGKIEITENFPINSNSYIACAGKFIHEPKYKIGKKFTINKKDKDGIVIIKRSPVYDNVENIQIWAYKLLYNGVTKWATEQQINNLLEKIKERKQFTNDVNLHELFFVFLPTNKKKSDIFKSNIENDDPF